MSKNKKRITAAAVAVVLGLGLSFGGQTMAKHAQDIQQAEVDAWTAKIKIVAQNVTRDPILAATLAKDAAFMAKWDTLAELLGYERENAEEFPTTSSLPADALG